MISNTMKRAFGILLLFGVLGTCAYAQDAQTATVYFYRYRQMQGKALRPSVYCDDVALGRIQNGRVLTVHIAPGTYTFTAEDRQAGAAVLLEGGKAYYFRTDLQVGFWKGHFRLTMVQLDQGKYDTASMKPSDKDMVLHDTFPLAR